MPITWEELYEITGSRPTCLSYWEAAGIIRKIYCANLASRGFCAKMRRGSCQACAAYLSKMMALDDARNPGALLTWSARNQAAAANEDFRAKEKETKPIPTSEYPDGKEPGDPLKKYINKLEDL